MVPLRLYHLAVNQSYLIYFRQSFQVSWQYLLMTGNICTGAETLEEEGLPSAG